MRDTYGADLGNRLGDYLRQCLLKAINKKRKQKKRSRANINNLNK
jgi:hypothetical protein